MLTAHLRTVHCFIAPAIDLCDLHHPALALVMLDRQDLFVRPVKVIRNVRYLLIEPR
jgi:hypothetical protein